MRKTGSLLDNMVKGILGALPLGSVWKLIYSLGKTIFKFFGGIGLMLAKLLLKSGKWLITEGVGWLVGKLSGLAKKILGVYNNKSPLFNLNKDLNINSLIKDYVKKL